MAMAKPLATAVISHWYNLIENLEASPREFYASVVEAVKRRDLPGASPSQVDYHEGGAFSAMREYLRISRGQHIFDICGAPFGHGFFVSWWLGKPRPSALGPTLGAIAGLFIIWLILRGIFGAVGAFFLTPLVLLLAFIFLGALMSQMSEEEWVSYVLAVPVIGWVLERFFLPDTYYRIDTALMFQQAVHAAVMEVIDGMTKAKGLRSLSETERKPILKEFH